MTAPPMPRSPLAVPQTAPTQSARAALDGRAGEASVTV